MTRFFLSEPWPICAAPTTALGVTSPLKFEGRRIAAGDIETVRSASVLLERSQKLWQQTQTELQRLKAEARAEGHAQGLAEARLQVAQSLLDAQTQAQVFLRSNEQRLIKLAAAMCRRLVGTLPAEKIWPGVLAPLLREVCDCAMLRIYVSAGAKDLVAAEVDRWRRAQGAAQLIEVIGDPALQDFAIVVESELGRLDAGLDTQMERLTQALQRTAEDSSNA